MTRTCVRKTLGWLAGAWLACLPAAYGEPPRELTLPEVVVRGLDRMQLRAQREWLLPLEPGRRVPVGVEAELPPAQLPEPGVPGRVVVRSPGCAYRGGLTSAVLRATRGAEGVYKTALDRMSRGLWEEAEALLVELRDRYPSSTEADAAAFWLGEIRRRQGRLEEAAGYYARVRGAYRREARYRRAWLLDRLGRPGQARSLWEEIGSDPEDPHRVEALYRLGLADLDRDPANAAEILRRAQEAVDEGAPAPAGIASGVDLALALALQRTGDLAGAEAALVRFLLRHPDHPAGPWARMALGWVLLKRGRPGEAALRFRWVLEENPPEAIRVRALYGLVRAAVARGEPDRALEVMAADPLPAPWGPWAWAEIGQALLEGRRYEDALTAYRRALERWKGEGRDVVAYMEGEVLYLLGRFQEAASAFDRIPESSPLRPAALHRKGLCLLLEGRTQEAARVLETVPARYPAYPDLDWVWVWLGEARYRAGDLDGAADAFARVAGKGPARARALYGLAWVAFQQGRWDEAVRRFRRFLGTYPEDPARDEALLTLARALFNLRELRPALAALSRLEEQAAQPRYRSAARYYRGWMLARAGNAGAARTVLEALVADEPGGPYTVRALHTLGWLDFQAGEFARALERFRQVADSADDPELAAEARRKVADCLYNLGRFREALQAYRALPASPDALFGAGLCQIQLGDLEGLRSVAETFASRYPDDERGVDLLMALARALQERGDRVEAARVYERAARLAAEGPRQAEARLESARNLMAAGRTQEARSLLELLAERDDAVGLAALRDLAEWSGREGLARDAAGYWKRIARRSRGAERVEAYLEAARWLRRTGEWDGARSCLERAEASCPRGRSDLRQRVLLELGELLLLTGSPKQAAEVLEQAASLGKSPEGLRALAGRARAQEAANDPQAALETYLRMGYLYPVREEAVARGLYRAARMLIAWGEPERARRLLERVAGEGPDPWAARARVLLGAMASPAGESGP